MKLWIKVSYIIEVKHNEGCFNNNPAKDQIRASLFFKHNC